MSVTYVSDCIGDESPSERIPKAVTVTSYKLKHRPSMRGRYSLKHWSSQEGLCSTERGSTMISWALSFGCFNLLQ